jgi:hypothetical protein
MLPEKVFDTGKYTSCSLRVISLSAMIPKLGKAELLFFARHFKSMQSINLQIFMLIALMVSELCPGQSSKCKNEQRTITTKFGMAEFKFLCTAHLPIEVSLPTKFDVDISCSFRVISRTIFFLKGEIIQTLGKTEFFCSLLFYSIRPIYQQRFMLISLIILEKCQK